MNVDEFDFDLPTSVIAQRPVTPRDSAKLLRVADGLSDHIVRDLPLFLQPGDLLVFNNTKVIPARIKGKRGNGKVEATLHKNISPDTWKAFARPGRKIKPGDRLFFDGGFAATVLEKGEGGEITLKFDHAGEALMKLLDQNGAMPLPPYIKRDDLADTKDRSDYQTLFAEKPGAVAAPTASLHFTPELMGSLKECGVDQVLLTLHVGAGTFLPVKVDDTRDHKMHAEWGEITQVAAEKINAVRNTGGRIIAVGSTALRLLETAADDRGVVQPFTGDTDIFITPGYRFKVPDMMLTNFHLPRSTLFMLVAAFAGMDQMKRAYDHAMTSGYRFYSYGDCCLLDRS
ncbi:MAG: tRNA preQ1(34) S-adenosylmethionine ribosyltransferase-isomerase QueA [Rhodospirillaceae bacterium]|jgi:S-adenosylmethionine:tRNA ribosyltransferase-isomerase|nr:tRNA preQ1(34) S-adenosylmethionine ribosyltransferase-isomerase QueA [Rhodospirillaceae bacterium]MBT7486094.1 tRNA preQ1(34) S-adenosylmethionine ribosyltransferase-isomerase QueA [Rhodospirillales bacterium]MBT4702698.1 tRNA preQ1(34) S-adenosylmethionine ribosyltransferase-isomerase QueA [Rhodospirillaceae bacterium]MBT5035962.1 tRNA preQ1(34) S-adenosylmethionine ribosyltransferase-isomerase QueA [Rhodospirillaceae bacterium]MBT6220746.1 tRNA preQ1(34) S-adenosylmethionine ribosyltransf